MSLITISPTPGQTYAEVAKELLSLAILIMNKHDAELVTQDELDALIASLPDPKPPGGK